MENRFDIAVVGAGIVGLAIALEGIKQGKKVVVFDRSPRALGASIRNFGLVWPVGQAAGAALDRAMRSRAVWLEIAEQAGVSVQQNGSLTLAYHDDELAVLEEFAQDANQQGYNCEILTAEAVAQHSSTVRTNGLKAGLLSHTECTVSPRTAIAQIAAYLEQQGVTFYWNTAITQTASGQLSNFQDTWQAERIYICGGQDFESLYPALYAASGITRCKLQMMRTATQPDNWKLGPSLCAGLTLRHYDNFARCPSLAQVSARYDQENPLFKEWGIHVLLSQNAQGELIIGDSHQYGWDLDPFDRADINREILKYLYKFAQFQDTKIEATWHGVYPKIPGRTEWVVEVDPAVWIVNALSGAGMTLSFGLAQEILSNEYAGNY